MKVIIMNSFVVSILRRRSCVQLLSSCCVQDGGATLPFVRTFSTVGDTFFDVKDTKKFVDSLFNDTKDGDLSIDYVKKRLTSVLDKPVQTGESAEELSPSERQVCLIDFRIGL